MRTQLPLRGRVQSTGALLIWVSAAIAAVWLYRQGVGGGDVVGIAEFKEHRLGTPALGRIVSVDIAEGDQVSAGQVLARLETEMIQKEISVAEARRQHAASEIPATSSSLDIGLLQAERNFQSEVESVQIELETATTSSIRDKAELGRLNDEIQRQRDLVSKGLTKSDRLAELDLRRTALAEAVNNWPSRIEVIRNRTAAASSRLDEWRRAHAVGEGGSRNAQLQPIYANVRTQDANIRLLRGHLQNTVIRAASAGYVTSILARPGDVVKPGDPVVTLVEAEPRKVVAYVDERRGVPLSAGAKVLGRRRTGAREQFSGTISGLTGQVVQLPPRLWSNPTVPAWGRAAYIMLAPGTKLDAGETVDLMLSRERDQAHTAIAVSQGAQVHNP